MSWNAEIVLKSSKVITVADLTSICWKSQSDGSLVHKTDFKNFVLPAGRILTFIGEKTTVSLGSNEIEYLSLHQIN